MRPLVLIMPKMSGYVKTFEVKERDKDKSNKEKYKEKSIKLFRLRLKI